MKRVTFHWTAGGYTPNRSDMEHYHYIVAGNGSVVEGYHAPEDNLDCTDDDYAAHVRLANTGNIGVALAGMREATERPFMPGPSPITARQMGVAVDLVADLCIRYGIPVEPTTVLTHAEIEPTLGIKQFGKWDITRLPWDDSLKGAIQIGDHIRALVRGKIAAKQEKPGPVEEYARFLVALQEWERDLDNAYAQLLTTMEERPLPPERNANEIRA